MEAIKASFHYPRFIPNGCSMELFARKNTKPCLIPSFPLVLAGEGEVVKIVQVHGGHLLQERLLGMGIGLDDNLLVVHKQTNGAVCIEKGGCRYVLGGGMAHKIKVMRC